MFYQDFYYYTPEFKRFRGSAEVVICDISVHLLVISCRPYGIRCIRSVYRGDYSESWIETKTIFLNVVSVRDPDYVCIWALSIRALSLLWNWPGQDLSSCPAIHIQTEPTTTNIAIPVQLSGLTSKKKQTSSKKPIITITRSTPNKSYQFLQWSNSLCPLQPLSCHQKSKVNWRKIQLIRHVMFKMHCHQLVSLELQTAAHSCRNSYYSK